MLLMRNKGDIRAMYKLLEKNQDNLDKKKVRNWDSFRPLSGTTNF